MEHTLNAIDIGKYIVMYLDGKHIGISNMCLQRVLYVLQVEFLKRYGKPLFTNAISAWGFGPCIDDVYYKYCGSAGCKIWVLPGDKSPDIEGNYSAQELALIRDVAEKFAPYLIDTQDTATYETYRQLFGEHSLWKRIHNAFIEETKKQKEENPRYTIPHTYNPPMLLDDIKQSILEIGCYPKVELSKAKTKDITINVAPLVRQMIDILSDNGFDYKMMGVTRYHTMFQWTEHLGNSYDVNVTVSTRDENEPLRIRIELALGGVPVVSLSPDVLLGAYVLRNRNLTVKLTIR
ncbi:MAG: DUF4065 domain-containing protein [Clostridia bacterium]|nr:DUF4065 domain-containing protein [Clostridia bacterium]